MKNHSNQKLLRVEESLRHFPLKSAEFKEMLVEFEQWLRVFGFAQSTIYYGPVYVRSFFYFVEKSESVEIGKWQGTCM